MRRSAVQRSVAGAEQIAGIPAWSFGCVGEFAGKFEIELRELGGGAVVDRLGEVVARLVIAA